MKHLLIGFVLIIACCGFSWRSGKTAKHQVVKSSPPASVAKEKTSGEEVAARENAKRSLSSPWRTFSNTEVGFSLKYPAHWVKGNLVSPSILFLYLANAQNNPIGNINVQVIPVSIKRVEQAKEAVNVVAQEFIAQIHTTAGAKIQNDVWTTFGTHEGRELVFEYPSNEKKIRQRQFLTLHKNKVIAIIYTAEEKVYDELLNPYLTAVESLTFT